MKWMILTHWRPDLDAIVGIWLLRRFGEEKFPGISAAEVEFLKNEKLPRGKTAMELEQEGVICVDIGKGRFDHHQIENPAVCAADLVAKHLELEGDLTLEKILSFVRRTDLKGTSQPFDLAYILKDMHNIYPDEPEKVVSWTIEALEAKFEEQISFWFTKLSSSITIDEIELPDRRVLRVFSAVTDNNRFSRYARYRGAAVVIQKEKSGNVQIFSNRQYGLIIDDIVRVIRLEEMRAKRKIETTDWNVLASAGDIAGVKEWYYHKEAQSLLNGSLTTPDKPPTRLSLDKIRELVKLGLSPTLPNSTCVETKKCLKQQCPYYWYGLHRCRKLRYETQYASSETNSKHA